MTLLKKTKELCSLYNIKPTRTRGQNFLISENVYDKIIETADLNKDDTVLEVGPGLGFLTNRLAQKAKEVVSVELDEKLFEFLNLELNLGKIKNIKLINQNILDFSSDFFKEKEYKIVANLPYNITSIFLRKFLSAENKPTSMTLMLQKEVAERIMAKPGKMSLLAVSVQFYADAEIVEYVSAKDFWPSPEVDSAIISLKSKVSKSKVNEKDFFRLVKFGFSSKRKMLKNNLAGCFRISQADAEARIKKAGFNSKIRAQELSVEDWVKLFGEFQ